MAKTREKKPRDTRKPRPQPKEPTITIRYPDPARHGRKPGRPSAPPEQPPRPPKPGKWSKAIDEWIARREKEREHERERDECGRDRRKVEMPRPYLDCTSNFGPQILAQNLNEPGTISFTVWNDGNYPAWSCYVEVYEGPGGYTSPLSDYELRGRAIITLHPGERREVSLPWVRRRTTGRVVGIVHDPLLDPKDFAVVEQVNRHITSIHYFNLE